MQDILDEIEIIKPNNNYIRTIFLHAVTVVVFLLILQIFRVNISELVFNLLDAQIHMIGVLIFVGLIVNSILIAKRLSRDQTNFSNYKIALAGGVSFFMGNILYNTILRIFYYYNGVFSNDILHILVSSFLLLVVSFLYTLIRIKKIRKEKRRIETWILVILYFGIGYILSN